MDFLSIYKRFNNSIQTTSTSNFVKKRNGNKRMIKILKYKTIYQLNIIVIYCLQDIDEFLVNVKSRTYNALASTAKQTFQMTAAIVAQHIVVNIQYTL